jgi:hypothetical protein
MIDPWGLACRARVRFARVHDEPGRCKQRPFKLILTAFIRVTESLQPEPL